MDKSLEQSICEDVFLEFGVWNKQNSENVLKALCRGNGLHGSSALRNPIIDMPARPTDFTGNWDVDKMKWKYPTEIVIVSDNAGGSPMVTYKASFDVAPRGPISTL